MPNNPFANTSFETSEKVYHQGSLVSTRHPVTSADATTAKDQLTAAFPEYSSWIMRHDRNLIGTASNYRQPYQGNIITLYVFETPTSDVITEFGVDQNLDFCTWFGFKFDTTNNTVSLKIPFFDNTNYYTKPTFPAEPLHYANIYTSGGLHTQRDAYFLKGGKLNFETYCTDNSLTLPWSSDIWKKVSLWSICYDSTTLVPDHVKAYVFE